jgi:TonB family protein
MSSPLTKLVSLLLVTLLCSAVIAQDSTEAQVHFDRGELSLQSKDYNAAIKEFKQAIRLRPNWPEAHFELGRAYAAIPINPGSGPENVQAALKAFEEAVRLKPDWPEALVELASKYSSFQQYDKAIPALKQAISLKPELAQAHQALGMQYLNTGNFLDAMTSLKEAIRLKPEQPLPHKLLGLAYLVVDERDSALEEYKILQTLDPEMAKYLDSAIHSPEKPTFGLTQSRLISVPAPDYPIDARDISGKVTVEVKVDEQGKVTSARAISGPAKLRAAAEAAALKARFSPTKISGKAVSVKGIITFNFARN